MVGIADMFVRTGATINLTCIISRTPEPPAFVFWYHNERMINYDYPMGRGEITVQKDSSKSDSVISRLVIRSAKLQDSGNYTCSASNAEPTSLYVHVLQGMPGYQMIITYITQFTRLACLTSLTQHYMCFDVLKCGECSSSQTIYVLINERL